MTIALCVALVVAASPAETLSRVKKLEGNWSATEAQLAIRVVSGGKAVAVTYTNASRTIEHLLVIHDDATEVSGAYFGESGSAKLKFTETDKGLLIFDSQNGIVVSLKLKTDSEMTFEFSKGSAKVKKAFTREYVDALK